MSVLAGLPQPLIEDFLRDRWLPVVGAGFSRNAELPKGYSMPDWTGLATALGAELRDFVPQDAIDAISAYEEQYDRTRLVGRMAELLHVDEARPGKAHEALCRAGFDLILTTNFDFLLERTYESLGQPCQPLLTESQLPQRPLQGQAQLLKLHGDLNHPDELIATEEDYDGFTSRYPLKATFLGNLLITRTLVLVGYSLDDPDTRSLWTVIRNRIGSLQRKGYVILLNATATQVARFGRRNIDVVTLPGDDHSQAFAELFVELRTRYNEKFSSISRPTEDEVAAELVLPLGDPSRLCFCSVPVRLLPWYRSEVFPVIEDAGYVTVTRDEVLSPGSNAVAAINAVLARSALGLVDASSFSTSYELGMALDALPAERLIVIADQPSTVPAAVRRTLELADVPLLIRHEDPIATSDDLIDYIRRRVADSPVEVREHQALLNRGYPGAAVAVAFGVLEEALVQRAEELRGERPPGLMRLIRWASDQGIITKEEYPRFQQWVGLRNRAVHTGGDIDPEAVRQALRDIEGLIARLN